MQSLVCFVLFVQIPKEQCHNLFLVTISMIYIVSNNKNKNSMRTIVTRINDNKWTRFKINFWTLFALIKNVFSELLISGEFAAGNMENLAFFSSCNFLSHSRLFWTTNIETTAVVSMPNPVYYVSLWNIIPIKPYILLVCWQMWFASKESTRKLNFSVKFRSPCQKYHPATAMIAIWTPYSDSLTPETSY